jgi:hypothetical protein
MSAGVELQSRARPNNGVQLTPLARP